MKLIHRAISATLSAAVAGIMFVPAASACGPSTTQTSFPLQQLLPDAQDPMSLATPADQARDRSNQSNPNSASIVGMWRFQFISQGNKNHNPSIPDGTVLDFGYNQWHSDGTEVLNSGGRSPAQENFCLGVWEQSGRSTFQLNHFALNYDPATGILLGRIGIVETATVSPGGTRYSGKFVYTVFDTNGNKMDHLTGQVIAERITVDTETP